MKLAIEAITERGYVVQFAYDPETELDYDRYHIELIHCSGAGVPWTSCGSSFEEVLRDALSHVMEMGWERA
jgi:hypothetical protein